MSVVSEVSDQFLKPKHLFIGAVVFLGTGFLLSSILPGIGVYAGITPRPLVGKYFPRWPFVPARGNGGGRAQAIPSSYDMNSAEGYLAATLDAFR